MTVDDQTSHDLDALTADPGRLDGHTIDELADYLDNDRIPFDPSIERSAACRNALAALERLRGIAPDLLADDRPDPAAEDSWIRGVLDGIAADAHAGADFTVDLTGAGDETVMTEGALRALIRAAGDDQPGFLVGRVRFDGPLDGAPGRVRIAVDVTVAHGVPIVPGTTALRLRVLERVRRHTRIADVVVDIAVRDLMTRDSTTQDPTTQDPTTQYPTTEDR